MPTITLLDALLAVGGLSTVPELAVRTGLTARTVRAHAARSRCWMPFPEVVGLPRARPSSHDRARAATLQVAGRTGDPDRDLVAVTRRSALHLLGVLGAAPSRVELVVPVTRCPRSHDQLAVLRSRWLTREEVGRHEGIPILRGPALVRDLAAVRATDRLRDDAIELLRSGYLTLSELDAMLLRCRRFEGRGRVRRVLHELGSAGRADSPLELRARTRFRAAGILFDRGQVCVPASMEAPTDWAMHLDLGIAAIRFGIEVDSMAFHSSTAALRRDAQRANRVAALPEDWRVLHLTWWDLQERWDAFVALTRQVIVAQSQRFLGRAWPSPHDIGTGVGEACHDAAGHARSR